MKKQYLIALSRYLLYTGLIIQIAYIINTPFMEISSFILISTTFLMVSAFIDLSFAKAELALAEKSKELEWDIKRKKLQNYYNNEENLNKSFSECLKNIKLEQTHNERISKILDNYQATNKKFKIKLNRDPENRLEKYLHE